MKVTVCFIRVPTKSEYDHGSARWLASYEKYIAGYPHELVVIDRYADSLPEGLRHLRYDGGGWDCGSWQFAGKHIETDLLVCFNSNTYITGDGWLLKFVKAATAARQHPMDYAFGLWGPMTSNYINPHIRTPCMIFQPSVINAYPRQVMTREDTYRFEVFGWPDGTPNFTQWVHRQGLVTQLVTWNGVYDMLKWREPDNIFRRGDQSNLIVKDHHADVYEVSKEKPELERMADGR